MLPFSTELLPHINNTKNNNYMTIREQQQSRLQYYTYITYTMQNTHFQQP